MKNIIEAVGSNKLLQKGLIIGGAVVGLVVGGLVLTKKIGNHTEYCEVTGETETNEEETMDDDDSDEEE